MTVKQIIGIIAKEVAEGRLNMNGEIYFYEQGFTNLPRKVTGYYVNFKDDLLLTIECDDRL